MVPKTSNICLSSCRIRQVDLVSLSRTHTPLGNTNTPPSGLASLKAALASPTGVRNAWRSNDSWSSGRESKGARQMTMERLSFLHSDGPRRETQTLSGNRCFQQSARSLPTAGRRLRGLRMRHESPADLCCKFAAPEPLAVAKSQIRQRRLTDEFLQVLITIDRLSDSRIKAVCACT